MKVLLSIVFVSFSFLGFGQERELLETPDQLAYCNVQLWCFQQPDIIDVEKEIKDSQKLAYGAIFRCRGIGLIFYVDGVRVSGLPKEEKLVEIISNGLPTQYGCGFISLPKNPESGWY